METVYSPINKAFFKTEETPTSTIAVTQTSANHLADLAKHTYEQIEAKLSSLTAHNISVTIIGAQQDHTIQEQSHFDFTFLDNSLQIIAKLKSFIAFLREAIKEKDRLITESHRYSSGKLEELTKPIEPTKLSTNDIIDTWSTAKRRKYLELDTMCSTYGKYIHPRGYFYNLRNEFMNQKPVVVTPQGKDTLIYKYSSTLTSQEMDEMYLKLQAVHRKYEAELNGLKNEILTAIDEDYMQKMNIYNQQLADYRLTIQEIHKEESIVKQNRLDMVTKLKIIIPDAYKELYESLKG